MNVDTSAARASLIDIGTIRTKNGALEIGVRYKTSFWDALVLQATESAGAEVLCSDDLAAGQ